MEGYQAVLAGKKGMVATLFRERWAAGHKDVDPEGVVSVEMWCGEWRQSLYANALRRMANQWRLAQGKRYVGYADAYRQVAS